MTATEINFYEGEKKEISGVVRPKNTGEAVIISSAKYEVTKLFSNDTVIKSGECEVNGSNFTVLLEFLDTGKYRFEVTIAVGREVIIERADINVR